MIYARTLGIVYNDHVGTEIRGLMIGAHELPHAGGQRGALRAGCHRLDGLVPGFCSG